MLPCTGLHEPQTYLQVSRTLQPSLTRSAAGADGDTVLPAETASKGGDGGEEGKHRLGGQENVNSELEAYALRRTSMLERACVRR